MLSLRLKTTLHKKNSVHCCLRSKPYAMLFDRLQTTQYWNKSCAMLSKHIWLLQMLCQHLANIAQEKSQASIEQKDKIVWNNDIVVTCMLNLINLYCSNIFHVPVFIIYQLFLPYHILYMLLFLSIHKGFSFQQFPFKILISGRTYFFN